uniref:Uncharacterized protein n=1 Tax=Steinernema glaseri TaxID=37863 RepID=A0A1I8A3I2_9BILA
MTFSGLLCTSGSETQFLNVLFGLDSTGEDDIIKIWQAEQVPFPIYDLEGVLATRSKEAAVVIKSSGRLRRAPIEAQALPDSYPHAFLSPATPFFIRFSFSTPALTSLFIWRRKYHRRWIQSSTECALAASPIRVRPLGDHPSATSPVAALICAPSRCKNAEVMYCISSCYSFLLHSPLALFRSAKRRRTSSASEKCAREECDAASTTSTEEENDSLRRVSVGGNAVGNPIIRLNGGDEPKNFERCEHSLDQCQHSVPIRNVVKALVPTYTEHGVFFAAIFAAQVCLRQLRVQQV